MAGAGDYRLLDCLGYIEVKGRDEGQEVDVVGFISLLPDWADEHGEAVTLHSILQESFDSENPGTVPACGRDLAWRGTSPTHSTPPPGF
ncbi:hypothetical protein C8A03DRAFT_37547 [Achaetomium macrosporum]|uniref:Uncharacterized protein n=1 Tax=Achaetomium macrosporum TaxID=79813 RepID=A0AAN7C3Q5_9PEZI|nr:hypothetical protein C8A03DRAFT_37547 [Achaetomium macrosporum]